jgi:predicted dienelactone hydrolase
MSRPSLRSFLVLSAAALATALIGCANGRSADAAPDPVADAQRLAARQARLAEALPMPPADAVQVVGFEWTDAQRGRDVPVRLYLPAKAAEPVPLVVFSHGIGGSRHGYSYIGSHLAANGYASLHLQHVGSDNRLWRGNPIELLGRLRGATTEAEALARAQDLTFALDRALADPSLASRIDPNRIAAAGHSYGANTVLLAAGARVPGKPVLRDERINAVIAISAPPFHGLGNPEPILGGVQLPALHVTAEDDDIRIPGFESGVRDRLALYRATGSTDKQLVVFRDGSHSMFTDRLGTGGSELNPAVKQATRELIVAFLNARWRGQADASGTWVSRHAALLSERFPPEAAVATSR